MNLALALKIGGTVGVIGVGAMTIWHIVPIFQKSNETADLVESDDQIIETEQPVIAAEKTPEMVLTKAEKETPEPAQTTQQTQVTVQRHNSAPVSTEGKLNFSTDDNTYLYVINEETVASSVDLSDYSSENLQCKFTGVVSVLAESPTDSIVDCTISKLKEVPTNKQHKVGWTMKTENVVATDLSTKHNVFEVKFKSEASMGTENLLKTFAIMSKTQTNGTDSKTYANLKTLFGIHTGTTIGKTNLYIGQIEANITIEASDEPTPCSSTNWTTQDKKCQFFDVFNSESGSDTGQDVYEKLKFTNTTTETKTLKYQKYYLIKTYENDSEEEIVKNSKSPITVSTTSNTIIFKHITPVIHNSNYDHLFVFNV